MKKLKLYSVAGAVFTIIVGVFSHFVYEWSGKNFLLGFFFPVSESTWEHMKLCFFPMLVFALFLNLKISRSKPLSSHLTAPGACCPRRKHPCVPVCIEKADATYVTSALLSAILIGTCAIPVLFYTYSGILGQNYLPLDIASFVLSVLLAFIAFYRLSLSGITAPAIPVLALAVFVLAVCFFVFTWQPPDAGIFRVPG